MTNTPPHIILGVSPDATETEIKKSFRRQAKNWHPDRYQGSKEFGEEQFKRLREAYDTMLSKEYQEGRHQNHANQQGFFHRPNHFPANHAGYYPYPSQQAGNGQFYQGNPNGPMPRQMPTIPKPMPRPGAASVLGNGTVLLSGGFRPSQITPEMLRQLQNRVGR